VRLPKLELDAFVYMLNGAIPQEMLAVDPIIFIKETNDSTMVSDSGDDSVGGLAAPEVKPSLVFAAPLHDAPQSTISLDVGSAPSNSISEIYPGDSISQVAIVSQANTTEILDLETISVEYQKAGLQILKKLGIDFNVKFQVDHRKDGMPYPSGHWLICARLLGAASKRMMQYKTCCVTCSRYAARVPETLELEDKTMIPISDAPTQEQSVVPAVTQLEQDEAMQKPLVAVEHPRLKRTARGRPKKGTSVFDLFSWMEENRSGIYSPKPNATGMLPFHCTICNSEVNMFRSTTDFYLLRHERRNHKTPNQVVPLDDTLDCCEVRCEGAGIIHWICLKSDYLFKLKIETRLFG
jgi:hypothetical protein